jgi:hypothetical protein
MMDFLIEYNESYTELVVKDRHMLLENNIVQTEYMLLIVSEPL